MWFINLLGILLIAAIVWWFWLYTPATAQTASEGVIDVLVKDGVYQPSRLQLPLGQPTILRFLRKDASPCAGTVVFGDFDISEELPVDKPKDLVITPDKTGTFHFTCQMQMYRGEVTVTDNA